MRNKKAALELSINAIVILILAITMLGLGLAFMRNIFGSATEQFKQVTGAVEKQMVEQMKESGKIVDISRPKLTIKKGKTEQIYIGFKNVKSVANYYLIVNPAIGDHMEKVGINDPCAKLEIGYKQDPTSVKDGDVVVLPVNVKALPDAPDGTCFIDLEVCVDDLHVGTAPDTNTATDLDCNRGGGGCSSTTKHSEIIACRGASDGKFTIGGNNNAKNLDDVQHLQLVVDVVV